MSMNLIKEGPNGQLEFDFESLESLTSQQFLGFVLNEFQFLAGDLCFVNASVEQKKHSYIFTLDVILGKYLCFHFDFHRVDSTGSEFYRVSTMFADEIAAFARKLGELNG